MITTTLTEFEKDVKKFLDKISDHGESVIINRGQEKDVVILSSEEYSMLKLNQNHIPSIEALDSIQKGLDALEKGETTSHNVVMEELRRYVSNRVDK